MNLMSSHNSLLRDRSSHSIDEVREFLANPNAGGICHFARQLLGNSKENDRIDWTVLPDCERFDRDLVRPSARHVATMTILKESLQKLSKGGVDACIFVEPQNIELEEQAEAAAWDFWAQVHVTAKSFDYFFRDIDPLEIEDAYRTAKYYSSPDNFYQYSVEGLASLTCTKSESVPGFRVSSSFTDRLFVIALHPFYSTDPAPFMRWAPRSFYSVLRLSDIEAVKRNEHQGVLQIDRKILELSKIRYNGSLPFIREGDLRYADRAFQGRVQAISDVRTASDGLIVGNPVEMAHAIFLAEVEKARNLDENPFTSDSFHGASPKEIGSALSRRGFFREGLGGPIVQRLKSAVAKAVVGENNRFYSLTSKLSDSRAKPEFKEIDTYGGDKLQAGLALRGALGSQIQYLSATCGFVALALARSSNLESSQVKINTSTVFGASLHCWVEAKLPKGKAELELDLKKLTILLERCPRTLARLAPILNHGAPVKQKLWASPGDRIIIDLNAAIRLRPPDSETFRDGYFGSFSKAPPLLRLLYSSSENYYPNFDLKELERRRS